MIQYESGENVHQLRSRLKKYITVLRQDLVVLQNHERADVERVAMQERLAKIHAKWPCLVPRSLKDKIITMFRQQTSSEALKSTTCASCAESSLLSDCSIMKSDKKMYKDIWHTITV